MGIKVPTPFKKAVTTCQLTQFASCITHAIAALFLDSTPIFYNCVQVRPPPPPPPPRSPPPPPPPPRSPPPPPRSHRARRSVELTVAPDMRTRRPPTRPQVAYHIGMLKLFLPLLLGKKAPAAKNGGGKPVPPTPAQKEVTKTD